jgi:hypothetical protein
MKELREELAELERMYGNGATSAAPVARQAKRKGMSAAARAAVSARMKKYCTKPLRGSYFSNQLPVAA